MSHLLSRRLEQVEKSGLGQQESEQKLDGGDARVGMGTCCCSCLPLSKWTDHETDVSAEPEIHERQVETR